MTTHAIHYTHNPAAMEFKSTLIDQKGAAIEVTGQTLAELLEVIAMHLKAGDWVPVQEARVSDSAKTAVIGPTDITVAERASMMLGHGAVFPFDDAEAEDWAHSAAHGVFADLGDRRDIGAILHGVDGDMRAEMVPSLLKSSEMRRNSTCAASHCIQGFCDERRSSARSGPGTRRRNGAVLQRQRPSQQGTKRRLGGPRRAGNPVEPERLPRHRHGVAHDG